LDGATSTDFAEYLGYHERSLSVLGQWPRPGDWQRVREPGLEITQSTL